MRALLILLLLIPTNTHAFSLDTPLADPTAETRAKALFLDIRCSVCDGQAIASSNSQTAKTIRSFVRKQIKAGLTNEEIIQTLINRYGEDIYLKPPIQQNTLFLWLAPFLFILVGLCIILRQQKKKTP